MGCFASTKTQTCPLWSDTKSECMYAYMHTLGTLNGITHWKNYSWRAHVRVRGAEGDPEEDGRRTLANGWESWLWRLEDTHLREGISVRQFGRPCPLMIRHRRRRRRCGKKSEYTEKHLNLTIKTALLCRNLYQIESQKNNWILSQVIWISLNFRGKNLNEWQV